MSDKLGRPTTYTVSVAQEDYEAMHAEIASLRARLASLLDDAGMACENPCGDCAGCQYANDRATAGDL